MKKSIIIISALIIVLGSCKKFVDEELVSTLTYDYYKTDQGLEDLVRSAYSPLKYKFENEQAYCLWNFGVDEFILGDQFNFSYYNTYDPRLNPAEGFLNGLWTADYDGINRCNLGIELIGQYENPASKTLATAAQKNQRTGELYFLRGYYYFQMVQQFGGIPLVTEAATSARTDFARASVAEVYNRVITDLRVAIDNLGANASEQGRITKGAAQHFLAKAYLTRGSAVTDQRGQKATDMDSAAYYADQLIQSNVFQLEIDYTNLWNGVYPAGYPAVTTPPLGVNGTPPYNFDGKSGVNSGDYGKIQTAQKSKEVILAAQFINNLSINGSSGNRLHLFFIPQYDAGIPGLVRTVDNWNGRPYRRLAPSDYALDLFDHRNDSRFYKSFRNVFYANATGAPNWTAANAPSPELVGKPRYGIGDTAALFVSNTPATALSLLDLNNPRKFRYVTFARYYTDSNGVLQQGFNNNKYLALVKHFDPIRITSNYNEERGIRNGILARLAETYLIGAEAHGRKGNFGKALEYINAVRKRAAYRQGEFKNPMDWMFDGGTKGDVNETYTGKLEATSALWNTNAPSENYPPEVTSSQDRFIHFMLNERTRELLGELYRWEDLVRTETLVLRTKRFNKDATALQEFHKLRPIPQLQIDATTIDGKPMTNEQKKAYQNFGY